MTEERDVPPLDNLLADLEPMQERLDLAVKAADEKGEVFNAGQFLQNDLLPFLKDFLESTLYGFEDIQEMVEPPIEIPHDEAVNIVEILEATKQSNAGNTLLIERIERGLSALKPDTEDDEDEEEETN